MMRITLYSSCLAHAWAWAFPAAVDTRKLMTVKSGDAKVEEFL
jgi:hypothetical protein